MWQTIIHVTFIPSAVGIAYVDRLGQLSAAHRTVTGKAEAKAH